MRSIFVIKVCPRPHKFRVNKGLIQVYNLNCLYIGGLQILLNYMYILSYIVGGKSNINIKHKEIYNHRIYDDKTGC